MILREITKNQNPDSWTMVRTGPPPSDYPLRHCLFYFSHGDATLGEVRSEALKGLNSWLNGDLPQWCTDKLHVMIVLNQLAAFPPYHRFYMSIRGRTSNSLIWQTLIAILTILQDSIFICFHIMEHLNSYADFLRGPFSFVFPSLWRAGGKILDLMTISLIIQWYITNDDCSESDGVSCISNSEWNSSLLWRGKP